MKKKNFKITMVLLLAFILSTQILTAQSWLKTGNSGVLTTDYFGPQNNVPLNFKVGGQNAGTISSTGFNSFGYLSGGDAQSTALGYEALYGGPRMNSTVVGYQTLRRGGIANVAVGYKALISGSNNQTAIGAECMYKNIDGLENTGVGYHALYNNTTGNYNTASGCYAGGALWGSFNAGTGAYSLERNGNENTAAGALTFLSSPNYLTKCTALGYFADIGSPIITHHTVAIGHSAIVNAHWKMRLGNTTVTAIEGQVAYTYPSDGRFKTNVTEEVQGLNFITRLRPVVYNFDTRKFDEFLTKNMPDSMRNARMEGMDYAPSTAVRQSGFIAQEVEKTAKEIGYDFNGVHAPVDENDNYSIAYSQFVMPLVKSVQELNATNMALEQRIEVQEALIQKLLDQKGDADAAIQKTAASPTQDAPFLGQNAPNPTHGETTILYYVPESMACNTGKCLIALHDIDGRLLHTMPVAPGKGNITLQLGSLPDGIYSYQLIVNDAVVATHKLVVSK